MSDVLGLILLLGTALLVLVLILTVVLVRAARRPPRHTIGYALGRGLPVDPAEMGLRSEAWVHDRPGGVRLPVWEIEGGRPGGPTAVMIHGWGQSRIDMLPRLDPWRALCDRVVACDMRGHGDAEGGGSELGNREPEDLRDLLKRLGDGPTILVGHSLGASVAIAAAADDAAPGVLGIVALGPFVDFRAALQARLRVHGYPVHPMSDLAMAWFRLRGLCFPSLESVAARVQCPLLVVHGRHDPICPVARAADLAAAAPKGRLVTIEDAGHLDSHDVDEVAHSSAIRGFVEDLASGADRAACETTPDSAAPC